MGRQAYLTRLALGRSPFADPLRDDDGNLFLGPHVHKDAAKNYLQQFDEKGRPVNGDTEVINRKLRRAQNEVYKVAGIVRKRGDSSSRRPFEKLTETDKFQLLGYEHSSGPPLEGLAYCIDTVSRWMSQAIRNRIFVFKSYVELPLSSTFASEIRMFGPTSILLAGLPWDFAGEVLKVIRHWVLFSEPGRRHILTEPRSRYDYGKLSKFKLCSLHVLDVLWYSVEWPLRAFATLQSLQLIPPKAIPGWRAVLPWRPESPTGILSLVRHLANGDIVGCWQALARSPFVLAYLLDIIRESLGTGLHAAIMLSAAKPEEPDTLSIESFKEWCLDNDEDTDANFEDDKEYRTLVHFLHGQDLGIGCRLEHKEVPEESLTCRHRYRGPRSLVRALNVAFPSMFTILRCIPVVNTRLQPQLNDKLTTRLRRFSSIQYRALLRQYGDSKDITDEQIRIEAVLLGFCLEWMDAIEADIDIQEWARSLVVYDDDTETVTTATPDPAELFLPEEVTQPDTFEERPEPGWGQETPAVFSEDVNEPFRDSLRAERPHPPMLIERQASALTIPPEQTTQEVTHPLALRTLLESANPEPLLDPSQLPPTPVPGINRARSLPLDLPAAPVRRPTELDGSIGTLAEELRSRQTSPGIMVSVPPPLSTYRVTHLSIFPADTFALLTSSILTSILLLPLEIYYTRLHARSFLSATPGNSPGLGGSSKLLKDIWPASPWLGFREMGLTGSMVFAGRIAITFGVQGVLTTALWNGMACGALQLGRRYFGWGQF